MGSIIKYVPTIPGRPFTTRFCRYDPRVKVKNARKESYLESIRKIQKTRL